MRELTRRKFLPAILLASAMTLPMSTCAGQPGYAPVVGPNSWVVMIVFLWPLLVLAAHYFRPDARLSRIAWTIEPGLVIASATWIYFAGTLLARPAAGFWVGLGANALWVAIWAAELRGRFHARGLGTPVRSAAGQGVLRPRPNSTGVKFLPAFLLAASLVWPWYVDNRGDFVGPGGVVTAGIPQGADSALYHRKTIAFYAASHFQASSPRSWLVPLAFLWPVAVLALYFPGRATRLSRIVWAAEPGFVLASGLLIYLGGASTGRPGGGCWLALGANTLWLGVWVGEFRARFVRSGQRTRERLTSA